MADNDTLWGLLLGTAAVGLLAYVFIRDGEDEASPAFALLLSVLASVLSVCVHREWRAVNEDFRFVPFEVHPAAFSIWVLFIYPASLFSGGAQVFWCLSDAWDCPSPHRASVLYFFAAAWLCTSVWPLVFGKRQYYTAALSLFGASAFATTALAELGAWTPGRSEWDRWGVAMPCALLAGWTAVAFLIGVAIAVEKPAGGAASEKMSLKHEGVSPSSSPLPTVHPISSATKSAAAGGAAALIACAIGIAATLLPDPTLPLVAAWAVAFFTNASKLQRAASCVSLVAVSTLVLFRVYYI